MKRIIQVIIAVIVLAGCKSEKSYYVSVEGDDSNPGSLENPFATIERAIEAVEQTPGNTTVYIREGTYYLDKSIVFVPDKNRNKNAKATITAYPEEKVVVSGAVKLENLCWEEHKDGIWKTKVPEGLIHDQLFVNGILQHMARYPDYNLHSTHYNGTVADAISPERVKGWSNPSGGYVHALHKHEWGGYHWEITGKNEQNELILSGGYQNNRLMGMHDEHRFVENIYEELDAPGEWYVDKEQNILYYYPPADINIAATVIEVPQLKHLFEFRGSENDPVQYVSIENVELTHTLRTFMDTKEPLLRSDWAIYRGGAVLMEGAVHCTVHNCFFNTVGGNAVFFSNYNRNNILSDCHIAYAGASGVCFVGDPQAVRSPSFEYHEYVDADKIDRTPGPKNNNYPAECLVYNNLMYGLGRVEKQVAGVQISMSMDIKVSHNTIYDVPRSGININEGTWGGHVLEYNDIFNTVLETGDHGAFNSWGRDRYWHPDYDSLKTRTTNHPELILLDAGKPIQIRNNRFRCDHGWDIDLDDGSSNYHIYNNVCLNGGIKLREGFNRTVTNNIMINNSFHPHVWFANSNDIFTHNIVFAPYAPISLLGWGTEVDYNVFPDESSLKKAQDNGTDTHSVYGDFEFMNPDQGDFRVKDSSIALKAGFKNFEMDQFGVLNPHLKSIAKKVPIPALKTVNGERSEVRELMGARMKNVTTEGERSAAGISNVSGVWVLEVPSGSSLYNIVHPNDVILQFNSKEVSNLNELEQEYNRTKGCIAITVFRNQKEMNLNIVLPK